MHRKAETPSSSELSIFSPEPMAKPLYGRVVKYTKTNKGTSLGRRPIFSTMNKDKKRSWKKYRGQGR